MVVYIDVDEVYCNFCYKFFFRQLLNYFGCNVCWLKLYWVFFRLGQEEVVVIVVVVVDDFVSDVYESVVG